MAGNNLSPRQKMINMMYLVLTALLALNISSEILQAFEKLRNSLEITSNSYGIKNQELSDAVLGAIDAELKGGDSTHLSLKPVLSQVNKETGNLIAFLDQLTADLREIGEVDEATGQIIRQDERDKNYRYWMGPDDLANGGRGEGKAKELREKLEAFSKWANTIHDEHRLDTAIKSPFRPITELSGTNHSEGEASSKAWEYETFHGTPVIADLAMVEKFKMDVKETQSQLLQGLRKKVDGPIYKINKLVAMEAPSSRIVPAGLEFQTRLMVGMSSDNITPEFLGNGIKLDEGGMTATMTIAANGNVIPAGQNEGVQKYRAMIKVPKANGVYEELPLEGEFIVRKPEVVVRSATVQQLYKGCGNKVTVDVPALGEMYNPDFSRSTGGQVLASGSAKKEVVLMPTARKFNLSVYSKTNGQNIKIDNVEYDVVTPPNPRMAIEYRGRELDMKAAVNKRQTLKVKLIPDADFKRNLPRDARYKVARVKLLHQDNLAAPKTVATKTGNIMEGIDLNLYQGTVRNARPGDRIFIEIEEVKRVNFQGQTIDVPIPQTQLIQTFVVR